MFERQFEVRLHNYDHRLIQLAEHPGDDKLELRHSNAEGQISRTYSYTIDRQTAIDLALAILDYYAYKNEHTETTND